MKLAKVILLVSLLFLGGCPTSQNPNTILPPDFGGNPGLNISATLGAHSAPANICTNPSSITSPNTPCAPCGTNCINVSLYQRQVGGWQQTGLVTNGQTILFNVKGGWMPFGGNLNNDCNLNGYCTIQSSPGAHNIQVIPNQTPGPNIPSAFLPSTGNPNANPPVPTVPCQILVGNSQTINTKAGVSCNNNVFYGNGLDGLYMLLVPPGAPNPNASIANMVNPTTAIPGSRLYNMGLQTLDDAGNIQISNNLAQYSVYFKVLDDYYQDNTGAYSMQIFSGIQTSDSGIVSSILTMFQGYVNQFVCQIYNNMMGNPVTCNTDGSTTQIPGGITTNNVFNLGTIHKLLVLYVVIYAISYLMGLIQHPQRQVFIMLIKMGIIIQLFSTGSWNFFNTIVFDFFTEGVLELSCWATTAATGNDCINAANGGSAFAVFDILIKRIISYQTNAKIGALVMSYPLGFFYAFCIYVVFGIYILSILRAMFVYMFATFATGILMILAPIFISMMLFEHTKQWFMNWIKSCVGFFMQVFFLLVTFGITNMVFMYFLYRLLGFQITWMPWFDIFIPIGITNIPIMSLYSWIPDISSATGSVFNPFPLYPNPGGGNAQSLVFLDFPAYTPNLPWDADKVNDAITTTITFGPFDLKSSEAVRFVDIGVFLFVVIILLKINQMAPAIGQEIAQSSEQLILGGLPYLDQLGIERDDYRIANGVGSKVRGFLTSNPMKRAAKRTLFGRGGSSYSIGHDVRSGLGLSPVYAKDLRDVGRKYFGKSSGYNAGVFVGRETFEKRFAQIMAENQGKQTFGNDKMHGDIKKLYSEHFGGQIRPEDADSFRREIQTIIDHKNGIASTALEQPTATPTPTAPPPAPTTGPIPTAPPAPTAIPPIAGVGAATPTPGRAFGSPPMPGMPTPSAPPAPPGGVPGGVPGVPPVPGMPMPSAPPADDGSGGAGVGVMRGGAGAASATIATGGPGIGRSGAVIGDHSVGGT